MTLEQLAAHLVFMTAMLPLVGALLAIALRTGGVEVVRQTVLINTCLTALLGIYVVFQFHSLPSSDSTSAARQADDWKMVTSLNWGSASEAASSLDARRQQKAAASSTAGSTAQNRVGWNLQFALGVSSFSVLLLPLTSLVMLAALGSLANSDSGRERSAGYLLLPILHASLLVFVTAANVILLLIALEVASVTLTLLVLIDRTPEVQKNALRFFAWQRFGQLFLWLGVFGTVAMLLWMWRMNGDPGRLTTLLRTMSAEIAALAQQDPQSDLYRLSFGAIWIWCIMIGVFCRCGLFPFHSYCWRSLKESGSTVSLLMSFSGLIVLAVLINRLVIPLGNNLLISSDGTPSSLLELCRVLTTTGAVVCSLLAIGQSDLRRTMHFVVATMIQMTASLILSWSPVVLSALPLLLIQWTAVIVFGFVFVGRLQDRYGTTERSAMAGLIERYPKLIGLGAAVLVSLLCLPGTPGFVGLITTLGPFAQHSPVQAFFVLLAWGGCVWALVRCLQQVALGQFREPTIPEELLTGVPDDSESETILMPRRIVSAELGRSEVFWIGPLLIAVVVVGTLPAVLPGKPAPHPDSATPSGLQEAEANS